MAVVPVGLFGLCKDKNNTNIENQIEDDTIVGLYFSAHWCPPCKAFTPQLADYYKTKKNGKNLEIIFVSSDQNEEAFDEYYKEMPWAKLPFGEKEMKKQLSEQYGVSGIPTLVFVKGKQGTLVTKDGRGEVGRNAFPQ